MKKFIILLVSLFSIPSFVAAQAPSEYDESIYIFQGILSQTTATLDECVGAFDWNITTDTYFRLDLYSLQTKKTNSIVLKKGIKKVGELLGCQEWAYWSPANNFVPAYYEIDIDGMKIFAEGGGKFYGQQLAGGLEVINVPNLPAPLVGVTTTGATIVGPAGTLSEANGTVTLSGLAFPAGAPTYGYEQGNYVIIRLYTPAGD